MMVNRPLRKTRLAQAYSGSRKSQYRGLRVRRRASVAVRINVSEGSYAITSTIVHRNREWKSGVTWEEQAALARQ